MRDPIKTLTDIAHIYGDILLHPMHYRGLPTLEQLSEIKYTLLYYSPAETYPVYRMLYLHMIKSFELIPVNISAKK